MIGGCLSKLVASLALQIDGLSTVIADSLPESGSRSTATKASQQAPKWNERPIGTKVSTRNRLILWQSKRTAS